MADIELVIKIPEDTHERITRPDRLFTDNDINKVCWAVYNGTVLPEHGRLIDVDKLWDAYHDLDYDFYEALDVAPTILEATGVSE